MVEFSICGPWISKTLKYCLLALMSKKLPNLHFSSSSRLRFCNYKNKKKIYIFIFNILFRNFNVLSKAKPILKTL